MNGFGTLLRLNWRRNRLFYLVWVMALATLMPATMSRYEQLVPQGDPAGLTLSLGSNPTMRALLGPAFDLSQRGGFTMWRVGTFVAAALAMMAALGVVRSTRAEEEEGRLELIRSGAIGRRAPLAAGIMLALLACAVFGVATTLSMVAGGTSVAGSVCSGLGIALTGTVFAGVGAVFAQIFDSARTTRYWAIGITLGGLYLLRAMIDGTGAGSSVEQWHWIVPLEWPALARPYAGERWWVLLLPAALTALLIPLAFALEGIRDHGAGLRAAKLGGATAAPYLRDAQGLALRLQRGGLIGWIVGIVLAAFGMGSLSVSIDSMLTNNPQVAELFQKMGGGAASLRLSFFMAMLSIMGTIVGLAAVLLLARLRQEETAGRAEVMLATSTPRTRLALSYLLPAAVVTTILLLATGVLLPVAQAQHDGSWSLPWTFFKAAAVFLAGLAFVIGLATALLGWIPRWFGLAWAVIAWNILISWIMPLFNPPDWLLKISLWGYLPHLPTDRMAWAPVVIEGGIGLALVTVGLLGYRRRDIAGR